MSYVIHLSALSYCKDKFVREHLCYNINDARVF